MAKASPILSALNAGEWSPLLDGRSDIQGYSASAYVLEEFIATVQGPIVRRAGTRFVRAVKDNSDRTWLVPFVKSRATAYQIEFGDLYCRFYYDRAPVLTGSAATISGATQADPVVITATAHGYSDGDDVYISGVVGMTEINNRWFRVANKTTNTFELTTVQGNDVDGTAYTAYTSGGEADTPYEIVSPYSAAALEGDEGELNLDVVQSGDILYITDRSGVLAPRKLSRTSATSWAFSTLDPDGGPWLDVNATATTIYASGATGTVTLTASTSIFTADDVGTIIRIDQETVTASQPWKSATAYTSGNYVRSSGKEYKATNSATSGTDIPAHTTGTVSDGGVSWEYTSCGYGIARITAQGGTTATVTVLKTFPQTVVGSGNASTLWRRGAWSAANGYPQTVNFFRERLVFGHGQRLDFSEAGGFESFAIDYFGEILSESAISVTVQSSEANNIVGMADGTVLSVYTTGAEFIVTTASQSNPFGPNNITVSKQSAYGSRPIRPVRAGESALFVQPNGRKLRAMQYEFQVDNFVSSDLTVRADHITRGGITQVAFQPDPYSLLLALRSDGVLCSLTYDATQQVRAWSRLFVPAGAVVESVSVIPSPDGERTDLWLVIKRTLTGGTFRYIEYLQAEHADGDAVADAKYGDCSLTYSGADATTIYGFDHLEGDTLKVLVDGSAERDVVVSNGQVTVENAAGTIQAGLQVTARYASNRVEAGAADGTSQGKTKRITDAVFRVYNTLGGQAGGDPDNLDDIPGLNYREPTTVMGSAPDLKSGDYGLDWPEGYETDGRIWYVNDTMFPATLVSVMPQVVVSEAR
jgi:hypothetical protein